MAVRAIVLAAGAGTRMKSDLPKVLHEIAGRPLIHWVLEAVRVSEPVQVMAVVGHGAQAVRNILPEGVQTCLQEEQLGTGHAARVALESMGDVGDDVILVLPGDTPLLEGDTLAALVERHRHTGSTASVLTAELRDPTGYGRILRDAWDKMTGIVEHRDATRSQRQIHEVNAGVYAFKANQLRKALGDLDPDNVQGEYYLSDVVAILAQQNVTLSAVVCNPDEIVGVNSLDQLAEAARLMRRRINRRWMRSGVWMQDPERVYLDADVVLSEGVRLYAGVHLEGSTSVGQGAEVGPEVQARDATIGPEARVRHAVLRQAEVGARAEVGPYASLRPGTVLGPEAKAGTFVEMKNARIGARSKVPHLSYLGDVRVGEDANVGAGTITCNYDGREKHETVIGDRAFIGSDTMLVAPVEIGDDAVTGAGSVITRDVEPGALAVERSEQKVTPGYTARRRSPGKPEERTAEQPEEEA